MGVLRRCRDVAGVLWCHLCGGGEGLSRGLRRGGGGGEGGSGGLISLTGNLLKLFWMPKGGREENGMYIYQTTTDPIPICQSHYP